MKTLLVTLCCLLLSACGTLSPPSEFILPPVTGPQPASPSPAVSDSAGGPSALSVSEEEPLFALADSVRQAEGIAAQYGIRLVRFAQGVATFDTEEDPHRLVMLGQERGWPPLSINYLVSPSIHP